MQAQKGLQSTNRMTIVDSHYISNKQLPPLLACKFLDDCSSFLASGMIHQVKFLDFNNVGS